MPALLIRMSQSSDNDSSPAVSSRSTDQASPPRSVATWSARSESRSAMITFAPAPARARAQASPIPVAAPVINADRPDRSGWWFFPALPLPGAVALIIGRQPPQQFVVQPSVGGVRADAVRPGVAVEVGEAAAGFGDDDRAGRHIVQF